LTPEQKSIVQDQQLAEVYKDFVERVAQGRHLKVEEVEAVAQGRVWTGEQAIGIKLVDKLGDMDTAIADAKTEAKLRPDAAVDVVELPEQPSFLEQAFGAGGGNAQSSFSPRFARALAPWLRVLRTELAKVGAAGAVYCYRLPAM